MFIHPSIHLEISRQRQQAILGERERDRIAKVVLADSPPPKEAASRRRPSWARGARRPQGASA